MNQFNLMTRIREHDPKTLALTNGKNEYLTYGDLLLEIERVLNWLSKYTLQRIAITGDNSIAQTIVDLAALEARIPLLQLPPFFSQLQIKHALNQSQITHLLTDKSTQGNSLDRITIRDKTLYLYRLRVNKPQSPLPKHTAKITFTSGSTAQPRGLCLSEEHLISPVIAITEALADVELTTHLAVLPQAVLLETVAGIYASLYSGIKCVLASLGESSAAINPGDAIFNQAIENQASSLILVPELLSALLNTCQTRQAKPESVNFIAVGGSYVRPSHLQHAKTIGLPVYQGYGLSEAGSVVTLNTPLANKTGTVGKVLSHQSLYCNRDNELVLHKPGFLGYCDSANDWAHNQASSFATGDLGCIDNEGYVTLTGRKKNVIITSMGRNISPEWLESLLLNRDGIHQCVVYGDGESTLSAILVSNLDSSQIQSILDRVNEQLPRYARIDRWCKAAAFTTIDNELTNNGKLIRQNIIKRHCEYYSNH